MKLDQKVKLKQPKTLLGAGIPVEEIEKCISNEFENITLIFEGEELELTTDTGIDFEVIISGSGFELVKDTIEDTPQKDSAVYMQLAEKDKPIDNVGGSQLRAYYLEKIEETRKNRLLKV